MRFREMGVLGSEFVAANFEQGAQIRQLERFYDEAVALATRANGARGRRKELAGGTLCRAGADKRLTSAFLLRRKIFAKVSCHPDKNRLS